MRSKTMYTLSAPRKADYEARFTNHPKVRTAAARLLGVKLADMIEVEINGVTYCYRSQAEADADKDGAYTVQYSEVSA